MRNKILTLFFISFIYSSSYGQFNKLVLKSTKENRRVCVKKNHNIIIYVDTIKYEGKISNIGKDFIEIRIYGRNPNKMEFDSVPANDSHYDKHIRQGWYCKSEPYFHTGNFIRVFYRSTDFEKISFKKINYFQYQKMERTDAHGMESLVAGVSLLTSPIWLNIGEKPNWTLFFVCAGIVSIDVTVALIQKSRHKIRNYKFNEWKIKKIK